MVYPHSLQIHEEMDTSVTDSYAISQTSRCVALQAPRIIYVYLESDLHNNIVTTLYISIYFLQTIFYVILFSIDVDGIYKPVFPSITIV